MRHIIVLSLLAFSLHCLFAATMTGKVVGADGKPVKGTIVCVQLYGENNFVEPPCDADGCYSFDIDLTRRQSTDYMANITAYAPGFALTVGQLKTYGNVLSLRVGTTINGTVVTADGKPIAGVPVRLSFLDNNHGGYGVPDPWHKRFTAITSADGVWTLPGIPEDTEVTVSLDDDRFVHDGPEMTFTPGKNAKAAKITVRPGATVTGRLLTPEGMPATHAHLLIFSPYNHLAHYSDVETDADGRYRFTGLITAKYNISASSDDQAWVADPLEEITASEGKVTTVPDLHTHVGAVLEGNVVDAETGMPIPAVNISLYRSGENFIRNYCYTFFDTDKNGHFLFRTDPISLTLRIETPQGNYLKQNDTEAQTVELHEGKTAVVTIKLHKGLSVTGTVMDEEGKPAVGLSCYIIMPGSAGGEGIRNETKVFFNTDQLGHFEAIGLPAGKGTFNLDLEDSEAYEWDLPTPLAIEVPSKEPLIIKVQRITLRSVTGRVVDSQRLPLSGVTATFSAQLRQGWAPHTLTTVTGADGCYKIQRIPKGVSVNLLSLSKTGYRQHSAGTLNNAGQDTLGDAVMLACSTVVYGKVCDINGKPVPGATVVSVEGGLTARAVTDEAGAFTLASQPSGELHLVAATPTGAGLATWPGNIPAVITWKSSIVANPTDIPLALRILDAESKLPKPQRRFSRADALRALADVDLDRAEKLAMTGDKPIPDGLRAYLLGKEAEKNPANVKLSQLESLQNPVCKLYAAVETGMAVINTNPKLADQLYHMARTIYDSVKHDRIEDFDIIEGLGFSTDMSLCTIALAGMLNKTADLDAMLARLIVEVKKEDGIRDLLIKPLFEQAGRVSP